jgi:chromosome segregation ATPase
MKVSITKKVNKNNKLKTTATTTTIPKQEPLKKYKQKQTNSEEKTILDCGLKLGGIWRDAYDKICSLENELKHSNEQILMLNEDRDTLIYDRINLNKTFKYTLTSLSDTELSHLQAQQIINHVLGEKHDLDSKCHSLLSQRDWLENERFSLRSQVLASENLINDNCNRIQLLENSLKESLHENIELKKQLNKRDDNIETLKLDILAKDDEIRVLKKSLDTKDRQLQVLVKERNRTQDDLDRLRKSLKPRERNLIDNENNNLETPNKNINIKSPTKSSNTPNGVDSLNLTPQPQTPTNKIDKFDILSKLQEIQESCSPNKEKQYHMIIKKLQWQSNLLKLTPAKYGLNSPQSSKEYSRGKMDNIAQKLFSPEKDMNNKTILNSNPW